MTGSHRQTKSTGNYSGSFGWKAAIANRAHLTDTSWMWRTPLAVFLSAILGSVLATVLYSFWLAFFGSGAMPSSSADVQMGLAVFLAASWFTIPGALLLAGVEFALSGFVRSEQTLDGTVVIVGALAGATILGVLGLREAPLDFALLGGFYGLTTALLFCVFQRQLGSRRERDL